MITLSRLKEVLRYDPDTGIFVWIRTLSRRAPAGTVAGCVTIRGNRTVCIDKKLYAEHRLAWLYVTGEWPSDMIDHIDRDKTNNRIANLREASMSQNQANRKIKSDSSHGFKGVTFHKQSGRWNARVCKDGKTHSLGYFDTPAAAHEAYKGGARYHHGEFARFA